MSSPILRESGNVMPHAVPNPAPDQSVLSSVLQIRLTGASEVTSARRSKRRRLRAVPVTRVNQFAVGWMRAAFEQSRVIAKLTQGGMSHAAAPNLLSFWELAVRLHWFAEMRKSQRKKEVNIMLDQGRSTENTTHKQLESMSFPSDIGTALMGEFVLDTSNEEPLS